MIYFNYFNREMPETTQQADSWTHGRTAVKLVEPLSPAPEGDTFVAVEQSIRTPP